MGKRREEFYKRIKQDKEQKIQRMKETFPEKIRTLKKLKNDIEKGEDKTLKTRMTMETIEEFIQLCESKLGKNLERLDFVDNQKVENFYQAVNDYIYIISKEYQQEEHETASKSIED